MRPQRRPPSETSIRLDQQQGRVFDGGGAVRVINEDGFLVDRLDRQRDAVRIQRLIEEVPNATPVYKHGGQLVAIRLESRADDRGHSGERHGSSIRTTERLRNDWGQYLGTDKNVQHKRTCDTWGEPAVKVRTDADH